jgi:predicted ATPase/DNA-binding SARP family transcriptional activator
MLRICLFGKLRLSHDGQPWQFSAPPKTLPLWAYLLLHRASPLPRPRLAFTLWPDEPEDAARKNLRRHLSYLRHALPPAPDARPWLLADTEGVQWNPEADDWLDVAEFERLCAEPGRLPEAVALYEADLLADLYDDWIIYERERLRRLHMDSLEQLVRQERARRAYAQAIAYARQLLRHDPLHEAALRELIELQHDSGDRSAAVREYRQFEQRLREELGVAPMPETQAAFERIRAGQAEARPTPHNLPAQVTSFVGREGELAAIQGRLAGPGSGVRLLTLTGPGGAGKTRLALEAGARLLQAGSSSFRDGLFFVGLADVAGPELVGPAILQALGLSESGGQSPAAALQDYLRSRHVLLILDNFEHVTAAAFLVADLLRAAPHLRVLATSRGVLRVYGEHEFPVPPLGLPDLGSLRGRSGGLAAELARYSAVALFVERSRAARADFALTEANAAAVAEICVRLDGLPLAIELAAARSRMLAPAALLARMSSRLAFLSGDERQRVHGLARRQQTLRATIDWSYHLLAEDERRLFARLGVFAGGFDVESAQAVAGDWRGEIGDSSISDLQSPISVEDGLALLLDNSLLHPESGAGGEPRYRMLLTLREYALEKLAAAGELPARRDRHAACYLALAEQAQPELTGPRQQEWAARLEAEHDNLRAALAWYHESDMAGAPGLRLAAALGYFWYVRSHLEEGRRWLAQAIARWPEAPPTLLGEAYRAAGVLATVHGDYAAANDLLRSALALFEQAGPAGELSLARALNNMGGAQWRQGNLPEAQRFIERGLEVARRAGHERTVALALNFLGILATEAEQFELARARHQEGHDLYRRTGDRLGVADSLNNLGHIANLQGRWAEALPRLNEALAMFRQLGNRHGIAIALSNLGEAHRAAGDAPAAEACYLESIAADKDYGNEAHSAYPLCGLGMLAFEQGNAPAARDRFAQSLAIWRRTGNRRGMAQALEGLAWAAGREGRLEEAARLLGAASTMLASAAGPPPMRGQAALRAQAMAEAQAGLSPEAFAAAWQGGTEMDPDQIMVMSA